MEDQRRRVQAGIGGLIVGTIVFVAGFMLAHFSGLSEINAFGEEIYPNIPRGWQWVTLGQLTALAGSQIMMLAVVIGWIWKRSMTWAIASVAAGLVTLEMIILFGVIPNEWLTLTQGEFEWTSQNIAMTLPTWLTLNNEVSISYGAIKDAVSGGYSAVVLGIVLVTVYQVQERAKKAEQPKPDVVSTYGRPVVRGDD